MQVRLPIALLETHVRLRKGIEVTQTDWESFIWMQVTGEVAGVEDRAEKKSECRNRGRPIFKGWEGDKEPEERNKEYDISRGRTQAVSGHRQNGRRDYHGGI